MENTNVTQPVVEKKSSHKVLWGVLCLVVPFVLFVLTLSAYAITAFISQQSMVEPTDTIMKVQSGLGIFGMVDFLAFIVGIPVGIVLLVKSKKS